PDAAEDDADHAADLRRDPGLPARGPGAVPGGQRRPGPAAAVGDHQEVRRAAAQAGGGEELTCTGPPQGGPCASGSAKLPAMHDDRDTIVAIATAPGAGGVGIVRLSGPRATTIAREVCGVSLRPRVARHVRFRDADGATIDDGIGLHFRAPARYTGEDVVELQAHGSRAVLQQLVDRCHALGARGARPGEFSERAFLHGKLDLAQAEAVADLIAAGDARAARAARRALDGEFSRRIDAIAAELLALRVHVQAAIDFADEPPDTLGGGALRARL